MERTAIIIVNWNGWKDTVECLESFEWPVQDAHFFILDNYSTDDSAYQLERYLKDRMIPYAIFPSGDLDNETGSGHAVSLVLSPSNEGFAGGNNIILRHLLKTDRYRYAWLLNSDTKVKKDSLSELLGSMNKEPDLAFCGSVLLDYYKPELIQCCGVNHYKYLGVSKLYLKNRVWEEVENQLHRSDHPPTCYQIGASLLVDVVKLKEIGLMDEIYFLYSEEVDWQIRARKSGYGNSIAWKSIIYHKGNVSTAGKKDVFFYHYNRSAVILSRKNFGPIPALTASFSLAIITTLRSGFAFGSVLAGIKGIFAGWRPQLKTS